MENNPFPVEDTNLQGLGFAKVPLCGKTHWIHITKKKAPGLASQPKHLYSGDFGFCQQHYFCVSR